MREILFRGKRTDNGEWVYGNLVYGCDLQYAYIVEFGNEELCRNYISVDPATVGQYTGKLGAMGSKIFEGDIVLALTRTGTERAVVEYNHRVAMFRLCPDYIYDFEHRGEYVESTGWTHKFQEIAMYEVVGNIHDREENTNES